MAGQKHSQSTQGRSVSRPASARRCTYQDRHATPLADRAAAALAHLTAPQRHADLNGPGHNGPGMGDLRAAIVPH
jgi:hypothetical protein